MTKNTLELREPIETTQDDDGRWVARLGLLDIEVTGPTHAAAQGAAFQAMLDKLGEMDPSDAKAWIEANSIEAPPDASCSV